MTEFYIFGGIIALIVFDRLFMPPLNAYGRRPLVEVWAGYVLSYVASVHAAYQASQAMEKQTERLKAELLSREVQSVALVPLPQQSET